ncbi:MAG: beta-galactosidase trimerization domain-containing protein [Eubacteriales bacterium]|nr:beta-galactosidase trimerization domain-containing protein [Eubacteriales bacterium]
MSEAQNAVKPESSWEERFGWYHYDGDAIYKYTEADLNDAAELYRKTGITAVILFGAHFRFSFWAYWEDIESFIARFTAAFHKRGIKVIEHHSAHLTYRPLEESFWSKNTGFGKGLGTYPNFRETSQSNPLLGGAHLDDFAQTDGSTGKPCLSSYIHTEGKDAHWIFRHYIGNAHCFNHPAFEEAYWGHVRNIIEKAHVDGMMNDDVQWYGGGNACACEYCRAKFREETGYDLPYPDKWGDFFEHYEKPEYVAWKRFKKKQSGDFHRRMDEKYKSIGFYPMRPAYCAEVLPFDTTCYGFEAASELWDYIFQECCGIIKHSYICFAGEAIHRYAMAQRRGVPSMALLYPSTPDSTYASWALCRSWGQLYTGTGGDVTKLYDGPYREFERLHKPLYRNPLKKSDMAFYFSETTRDYTDKDAPQKYMKPYMSYLESAYVSNISCDMVFKSDRAEKLGEHRVIVVPYIVMLSDTEAAELKKYAENGGTLIILGPFAQKDDDGAPRTLAEGLKLVGLKSKAVLKEYIGTEKVNGIAFDHAISPVMIEEARGEVIATGANGEILGVSERIGKGRLIYHPADISFHPIQPAVWIKGKRTPVDRSYTDEMKNGNGRLLEAFIGQKLISCENKSILASVFETEGGTALHLVNSAGMLPESDTDASREDPIPPFCDNAEKIKGFDILLNGIKFTYNNATMYSPEFDGGITVPLEHKAGGVILHIPGDTFAGYAVVRIN